MPIRPATSTDLEALAELAATTFPLAAPDDATAESLATFIEKNLTASRFADYLADPACDLLVHDDTVLSGYALLVTGGPEDSDVEAALTIRPTGLLSKFYVSPDAHGHGIAARMITAVFAAAEARGLSAMWLGVNQENARAQRFYAKHGFETVGTKRFQVGDRLEHDFVLQRSLRVG